MLNQKKLNTKILDSFNQSGSDYCKLPDGTMIQWGHTSVSNLTTNVTMSASFKDTSSYKVQITLLANTNDARNVTYVSYLGVNNFSFGTNSSTNNGANWLAIGKWK